MNFLSFLCHVAQIEATKKTSTTERGSQFFSNQPSKFEGRLGINFVRLSLETLIKWHRSFGVEQESHKCHIFTVCYKTVSLNLRTLPTFYFINKEYILDEDLATWNFSHKCPRTYIVATYTTQTNKALTENSKREISNEYIRNTNQLQNIQKILVEPSLNTSDHIDRQEFEPIIEKGQSKIPQSLEFFDEKGSRKNEKLTLSRDSSLNFLANINLKDQTIEKATKYEKSQEGIKNIELVEDDFIFHTEKPIIDQSKPQNTESAGLKGNNCKQSIFEGKDNQSSKSNDLTPYLVLESPSKKIIHALLIS